jgi:hypothetical protein
MEKMARALRRKLVSAPEQVVGLIVRTDGDPTAHMARLSALGLRVERKFNLLPGVSVTGRARAALKLVGEEWVLRIEEDVRVSTS